MYARMFIVAFILGAAIGVGMCIAFGVLDIQCSDDPTGPYWNAQAQACQAHEVKS